MDSIVFQITLIYASLAGKLILALEAVDNTGFKIVWKFHQKTLNLMPRKYKH